MDAPELPCLRFVIDKTTAAVSATARRKPSEQNYEQSILARYVEKIFMH